MGLFFAQRGALDRWLVFAAVSLAFFFLNLATFTSLGVVLYTMVADLHWSMTEAGFSFSLLGFACGLSSPLPTLTMRWFGCRATMCMGTALLFFGFVLSSISQTLVVFYAAMLLLGLGYSLAGNVTGVCLIAAWFRFGSSRMIGFYLMLGALGAAFGPPLVEAIVSATGWRGNWEIMAVASALIGAFCLAFVRDAAVEEGIDGPLAEVSTLAGGERTTPSTWTPREAVFTSQFMLVGASMAITMACVTTISSITVSHLVKLGSTPTTAAYVLSLMAITATLVKGVAGRLCEKLASPHILAVGLGLEAIGCVLLAIANSLGLQYVAAVTFGAGWGLAYVAGTVVLLDYFGPSTGSKILSIVWLLTTVAAAGPLAAGIIADSFGTFVPIFQIYAAILVATAVPVFIMRMPAERASLPVAVG